jgi:hypothetical protein
MILYSQKCFTATKTQAHVSAKEGKKEKRNVLKEERRKAILPLNGRKTS